MEKTLAISSSRRLGILNLFVGRTLACLAMLLTLSAGAASATTLSYTNSTTGGADASTLNRTFVVPGTDFPANEVISSVTILVNFSKINGANAAACPTDGGGQRRNPEASQTLTSPAATVVNLFTAGTYTSNANGGTAVNVTFDQTAGSTVGGAIPQTGTFRPTGNLNTLIGQSPTGTWTLAIGDTIAANPHCFLGATLTITTAVLNAPSIPDLATGSDSGASSTDNITNDSTPTFTGTCLAGATVEVRQGASLLGSGTCAGGGTYSITTGVIADGTYNVFARQISGGVTSPDSGTLSVTIDTAAPATPSVPDLDAASDSGPSNTDNYTNDNTPTFNIATCENGATVTLRSGGTSVASSTCSGGTAQITTGTLGDGNYNYGARQTDVAGNVSGTSATLAFTIDTTAPIITPGTPDLTNASDSGTSNTDNITNVTTPTFSGTCLGNSVELLEGLTQLGTVACGGGTYTVTSSVLSDGAHTVRARRFDQAGNVTGFSGTLTVTIDTTAPVVGAPDLDPASDTGNSSTDDLTNDTTPTLTTTCETGTAMELREGTNLRASGTCTGGTIALTSSAVGEGTFNYFFRSTDTAGNSTDSSTLPVTVDTTASGAPNAPVLTPGSDSGASSSDGITNVTTPTLSVTCAGPDGDSISVFEGVTNLGTATCSSGTALVTTSSLSDAVHTVFAVETDPAGNASAASSNYAFTVDTVALATDTPDLDSASDSGASNSDDLTNVTTPFINVTSCEDSATVELFLGLTSLGSATCSGGTAVIQTSTLGESAYLVHAIQTDLAGNVSVASPDLTFTVDTTATAAPGTPDLDPASDSGASNNDDITNVTSPVVNVSCSDDGDSVVVYNNFDLSVLGTATCSGGNAAVTLTIPLDDTYAVYAVEFDPAGNASSSSSLFGFTVDTSVLPPSAPDLTPATDTGSSNSDDITNLQTVDFTVTCDPSASVELLEGISTLQTVTCSLLGSATFTNVGTFSEGPHTVYAIQTDVAGNVSASSSTLTFTVDITPFAVTGTPDLTDASDSGVSITDNITNVSTPTFTVPCTEAGVTVVVAADLSDVGSALCNGVDATVTSSALLDGVYSITSHSVDTAGNKSADSSALSITIDTTPTAPGTPNLDDADDSGTFNNDDVTSVVRPSFTLSCEINSNVELRSGLTVLAFGVCPGSGSISLVSTVDLTEGVNNITARQTDLAGNVSADSSALPVTLDTTAPAGAGAPDLEAASDSGDLSNDDITNDTTPSFVSTCTEATSKVHLFEGVTEIGVGDCDGANATVATTFAVDGNHTIYAVEYDLAGNQSAPSSDFTFLLDTTEGATGTPDLLNADDSGTSNTDNLTSVTGPRVTVSCDTDAHVTLVRDVTTVGTVDCAASTVQFTDSGLTDGSYVYTAFQTDVAGNVSVTSSGLTVTIDTTAPASPGIPDLDAASDSGVSNGDNITNVTTPSLTIPCTGAGNTVILSEGATDLGSGTCNGTSVTIVSSALSNAVHALRARAVDAAGNVSANGPSLSVTIDTLIAVPNTPDLQAASDTGTSSTDNITSDATPTVDVTGCENGATVRVYDGLTIVGTATCASGTAAVTTSTLSQAVHNLTADQVDIAGNTSTQTAALPVTIDVTVPGVPVISSPVSGSTEETHTPTISGTGEPGGLLQVFEGATLLGSTTVSGGGSWSLVSSSLADGSHTITATVTDNVGNTGSAASVTFKIDADDDNDGILNSQDGTDSADGSGIPNYLNPSCLASTVLSNTIDAPINTNLSTFDGQVVPIAEVQDSINQSIGVRATYIDSNGVNRATANVFLNVRGKQDIVVNPLGAATNTYGKLHLVGFDPNTNLPLPPGAFDGLVATYRQTVPGFTDFDFAYASPFVGPIEGTVFASYNTNHPGLALEDFAYLESNIAQMTNNESFQVTGRLFVFRERGTPYVDAQGNPGFAQVIQPNGRVDVGVHDIVGQDVKGILAWVPDPGFEHARVSLQVNRYSYFNSDFSSFSPNSFAGVVTALGVKGRTGPIYAALDTTPSALGPTTAIVEASNVLAVSEDLKVEIYNKAGALVRTCRGEDPAFAPLTAPKGTIHCIADDVLGGDVGTAVISGTQAGSLYATVVHYSRLPNGSVWSQQAVGASDGLGARQTGQFNTYLASTCSATIGNGDATSQVFDFSKFDSNGQQVGTTESVTLPAHGATRLNPCSGSTADHYGQFVVLPRSHQSHIFGSSIREQADYTIGTSLRPAPAT